MRSRSPGLERMPRVLPSCKVCRLSSCMTRMQPFTSRCYLRRRDRPKQRAITSRPVMTQRFIPRKKSCSTKQRPGLRLHSPIPRQPYPRFPLNRARRRRRCHADSSQKVTSLQALNNSPCNKRCSVRYPQRTFLCNVVTLLLLQRSLGRLLLVFGNCPRPLRNIFGIHLHTFFQPRVMKSPLSHVHQILFA